MSESIPARLEAIWRATLSVDRVRPGDDFYRSGGDSMGVIDLVARVCQELDLEFEYQPFLASPTFETLCRAVAAGAAGSPHREAVGRAEQAASELLQSRPLGGESPPKQTLALALALSRGT